jgi:predicted DNA-binding protein (MmcQ/YjbR family)
MTIESIREYCLSLKAVSESFPFDNETLVFKVLGKMFALISLEKHSMNVKCDPDKAVGLRERYSAVTPGWHMNKQYWNTVQLDAALPEKLIREWIFDSYTLVVKSLPKKSRALLS